MLAEDLRFEEVFGKDPKKAFPMYGTHRITIVGVPPLRRLREDLEKLLSKDRIKTVFTRFGYETGLAAAIALEDIYDFDSPEEWLKAFSVMLPMTGIAREKYRKFEFDIEKKHLRYSGGWDDSFEALIWRLRKSEPSDKPVCNILCGLASGFFSVILGEDVLVKELSCTAMGHDICTFEARPKADWGEEAESLHESFSSNALDDEMERLKSEVSRAAEIVMAQRVEIERLKKQKNRTGSSPDGIIYRSEQMAKLIELCQKVAPTNSTILIQGESGTGKEVLARYIHEQSGRKGEPFVAISCAALPANLLESELFGHVKGAFTGAETDKKGLLFEAGNGTIFLDEVGELPLGLQAKLLRALQEKEARPVGGVKNISFKARIISATNQDLSQMVCEKTFRQDLYYRLSVFPLFITPLRQRKEDILILARFFLLYLNKNHPGFAPEAIRRMETYPFPGNIRELKNCVEYASILARENLITVDHLPTSMAKSATGDFSDITSDLPSPKKLISRYAKLVVEHAGGNKAEAARIMGVSTPTLWRYLKGSRSL